MLILEGMVCSQGQVSGFLGKYCFDVFSGRASTVYVWVLAVTVGPIVCLVPSAPLTLAVALLASLAPCMQSYLYWTEAFISTARAPEELVVFISFVWAEIGMCLSGVQEGWKALRVAFECLQRTLAQLTFTPPNSDCLVPSLSILPLSFCLQSPVSQSGLKLTLPSPPYRHGTIIMSECGSRAWIQATHQLLAGLSRHGIKGGCYHL